MSDDFRAPWEEAVAMYRAQKAEADALREKVTKLTEENRQLRAEVSRASYHCD